VEIVWCKLILIGTLRRRLPEGAVARQFDHERDIVAFDLVLVMDKFTAADVLREVSYCVRTFVLCMTQMNMQMHMDEYARSNSRERVVCCHLAGRAHVNRPQAQPGLAAR